MLFLCLAAQNVIVTALWNCAHNVTLLVVWMKRRWPCNVQSFATTTKKKRNDNNIKMQTDGFSSWMIENVNLHLLIYHKRFWSRAKTIFSARAMNVPKNMKINRPCFSMSSGREFARVFVFVALVYILCAAFFFSLVLFVVVVIFFQCFFFFF